MNTIKHSNEKEIVLQFAKGSQNENINLLSNLLSENGEFETQDSNLESIASNKSEFITWYFQQLQHTPIHKIDYDNCTHCSIGNSVILFNNGLFPRRIKDISEQSKTGLMLRIAEDKIIEIKFCYSFAVTENKYLIDCKIAKIKEYQDKGFSKIEAMSIVKKIDLTDLI